MELKSLSARSSGLSPPDCSSDPDEKEISDDEDDDRNHKHRRREARSQSLERESLGQGLIQPYRKRNRPYENGQSDGQFHLNLNRDFSRFEKRRPTGGNFSRFSGEHGSGRGRGLDFQCDSRFASVDIASQMARPGSIPSAMFTGRGLPSVSNPQNSAWSGFGLIPPIPNGPMDAINPLGLPGILGPQLNPSMNMGIQRQRCRDFEERGFCLRGDMCPMEHGINRIVVEDVQSLSQFNLPVSVPSAHMRGTAAGNGHMPSISVSSSALINSKGPHIRTNKSDMDDEALASAVNSSGADVYDPDQPLWNNDGHETSSPLLGLQPSNFDGSKSFMDADLSDRVVRSSGAAIGSQSTSSTVWGRLKNAKNRLELKEKSNLRTKASELPEGKLKEFHEPSSITQGSFHQGKQKNAAPFGPKSAASLSKVQTDVGGNARKPSQKAQRTLFVNCIPLKDNKKENLLSHFQKFGEVIDIYIPANSERAFVQFSKREEAERALKAPDAVMGSRFIKLWWANRDSIADEGVSNTKNMSVTSHCAMATSVSPHMAVVNKGKDIVPRAASKFVSSRSPDNFVTGGNDCRPIAVNSPKAPPPEQKKVENLELLREELRKKQELLEQKRNEFRQRLDKLAKHASGKSEVSASPSEKKQKVEKSFDLSKVENANSSDAVISGQPLPSFGSADRMVTESHDSQRLNSDSAGAVQGTSYSKQTVRPITTSGSSIHLNRYKLDNRPMTFRINAPLPPGLANVAALRDHFSVYGVISNVEIVDLGEEDNHNSFTDSEAMRNCSARISFANRHSAERAFLNGKAWHGHNLQLSWVTSGIPCSSRSSGESSSALKGNLNSEVQSAEKTTPDNSLSIVGPNERSLSPCKVLNEVSCDSSRSPRRVSFTADLTEKHPTDGVWSPDKSANYIPLEADEPDSKISEMQEEEERTRDGMNPDKDPGTDPTLAREK